MCVGADVEQEGRFGNGLSIYLLDAVAEFRIGVMMSQ